MELSTKLILRDKIDFIKAYEFIVYHYKSACFFEPRRSDEMDFFENHSPYEYCCYSCSPCHCHDNDMVYEPKERDPEFYFVKKGRRSIVSIIFNFGEKKGFVNFRFPTISGYKTTTDQFHDSIKKTLDKYISIFEQGNNAVFITDIK